MVHQFFFLITGLPVNPPWKTGHLSLNWEHCYCCFYSWWPRPFVFWFVRHDHAEEKSFANPSWPFRFSFLFFYFFSSFLHFFLPSFLPFFISSFLPFFLIDNRFFSYSIQHDYSFPSLHSSQSPLPSLFPRFIPPWSFFRKRAGLRETTTKHHKTKYRKTRQKPSQQDWTRQPNGGKEFQGQTEDSKAYLLPQLGVPQNVKLTAKNTPCLLLQSLWFHTVSL